MGAALRLSLLFQPSLHPDEALYASWALRIADGSDPLLIGVFVDKPPVHLYLLAGLLRLAGVTPASLSDPESLVAIARLAGLVAGVLSLVLVNEIAGRAYRQGVGLHRTGSTAIGLLATLLLAFSPLAIRLSPTLFPDALLTLWVLVGLWAALDRRVWLAGLACGLAYATKQQAVLMLPLVAGVWWVSSGTGQARDRKERLPGAGGSAVGGAWRFLNGFMLVVALVLLWDSQRWQWMPSYWDRSLTTYGGVALASLSDILARAVQWIELLGFGVGSVVLALVLLPGLAWLAWRGWQARETQAGRFDLLLTAFVALYLLVHLLGSFAAWDRYALPLVPLLSLLVARAARLALESLGGTRLGYRARRTAGPKASDGILAWPRFIRWAPAAVLALLLVHNTWLGAAHSSPVADVSAYDGVPAVARTIARLQPADGVVHQRWLGWHYGFYLYGGSQELPWWESAEDLAANAARYAAAGRSQLLAFPAGRDQSAARQALGNQGLRLQPELRTFHRDGTLSLTLYSLQVSGSRHGDVP